MAERAGQIIWPGLGGVVSGQYTMSQGCQPGTAVVKVLPQQLDSLQMNGDLLITDNFGWVKIPGCKIDKIRQQEEGDGFVWYFEILDWRWKWRDAPGTLSGSYNQLDAHGKLIPRTIRSPYELAVLCLQAMNVTKYAINLPPGLTKAHGEAHFGANPPWIGVVPVTGTNPPINWVCERPSQALENLVEQFGRRVVPRLSDYTVTIVMPGLGGPLPGGAIESRAPSIDTPEVPAGVAVEGDPTRFQMRLLLEPVGEEWDGSYRHINHLSYAPTLSAVAQVTTITFVGTVELGDIFTATINGTAAGYTAIGGDTTTNVATGISNAINGITNDTVQVTASAGGGVVTITSFVPGTPFTTTATSSTTDVVATVQTTTANQVAGRSWSRSPISKNGGFADAVATDRLTYREAVALAQKSVFSHYRVADIDVGEQNQNNQAAKRINVPGYGTINHRQQLILLPTKCSQVVPTATDSTVLNRAGDPLTVNFYNGYSRDVPAEVFGSHSVNVLSTMWYTNQTANTPSASRVSVAFHIDPEEQLVVFSDCVWYADGPLNKDPGLVLETAVNVRDNVTNAIVCYVASYPTTNNYSGYLVQKRQDVQLNVIGNYTIGSSVVSSGPFVAAPAGYPLHTLTGTTLLEQDAVVRANYYLEGMKVQYFSHASEIRNYHGIVPIDLDGAIQQVTWSIDDEGWASTEASLNTEHAVFVPPYPARRRAEFLRPTDQQNARIASSQPPRLDGGIAAPYTRGAIAIAAMRRIVGN